MQEPLSLTESTFRGLVSPVLSPVAAPAQGSTQMGDLNTLFDWIDKVLPRIESFMAQVERARGIDSQPAQTVEMVPMQNQGAAQLAPVPSLDPTLVYNKLLGLLNSLDQSMTVGEALEKTKQGKALIIPMISGEIDKLFKGGSMVGKRD